MLLDISEKMVPHLIDSDRENSQGRVSLWKLYEKIAIWILVSWTTANIFGEQNGKKQSRAVFDKNLGKQVLKQINLIKELNSIKPWALLWSIYPLLGKNYPGQTCRTTQTPPRRISEMLFNYRNSLYILSKIISQFVSFCLYIPKLEFCTKIVLFEVDKIPDWGDWFKQVHMKSIWRVHIL